MNGYELIRFIQMHGGEESHWGELPTLGAVAEVIWDNAPGTGEDFGEECASTDVACSGSFNLTNKTVGSSNIGFYRIKNYVLGTTVAFSIAKHPALANKYTLSIGVIKVDTYVEENITLDSKDSISILVHDNGIWVNDDFIQFEDERSAKYCLKDVFKNYTFHESFGDDDANLDIIYNMTAYEVE